MLSKQEQEKVLDELLSGKKGETVQLVCGIHNHVYGSKDPITGGAKAPNFKCSRCMFVEYMGLIINTPPDKREATIAALEESARQVAQADKEGRIDRYKLYKHPKIFVNDKEITPNRELN